MTADWIELEDGVRWLSDGLYRPGGLLVSMPARTSTGDVEWPPFEVPNLNPIAQPPLGIPRLTTAGWRSSRWRAVRSPPPTAGPASPRFTDIDRVRRRLRPGALPPARRCHHGAGALDILCHRGSGTCTLVARRGDDVQALFDLIPAGGHAEVCFPMGLFKLDRTVVVKGNGPTEGQRGRSRRRC